MNDNSKILVALLAGVAVGAALGILFAPDSGSDTRDKLSDALKDLGDTIKDRAAEEIENLGRVVDSVKSKFGPEGTSGSANSGSSQSEERHTS